jgi:hypothetical protein
MTDTAELRKLAEAATPGPWERDMSYDWPSKVRSKHPEHHNRWVVDVPSFPTDEYTFKDAAYIAAVSPDVLLALLDRLEAPADRVEKLEAALLVARDYMAGCLGNPTWEGENPYPVIDEALTERASK